MSAAAAAVAVRPANYVTINLTAACIGLTERAIRRKIEDGVWLEAREYQRGPDGRIYVHLPSVERWIEGRAAPGGHR